MIPEITVDNKLLAQKRINISYKSNLPGYISSASEMYNVFKSIMFTGCMRGPILTVLNKSKL